MNITENQRLCLMAIEGKTLPMRMIIAERRKQNPLMTRDIVYDCVVRMKEKGWVKYYGTCKSDRAYLMTKAVLIVLDKAGRHAPDALPEPPAAMPVVPSRTYVNSSACGHYVPPVWNTRPVANGEIHSRGVRC